MAKFRMVPVTLIATVLLSVSAVFPAAQTVKQGQPNRSIEPLICRYWCI